MTHQSHHIHPIVQMNHQMNPPTVRMTRPIAQMNPQNDRNHSTDETNHPTSRRNVQTTLPTNCRNDRNHLTDWTNCRNALLCPQNDRNHSTDETNRPTNCQTNYPTARMTHLCRTGFGRSSCRGDCSLL
jgi:hypothetical protein